MRLSVEEYRHGVLYWSPHSPTAVRVANAPEPEHERVWSAPLMNPHGSVLPFPLLADAAIQLEPLAPASGERPSRVRLERLGEQGVETHVWEDDLSRGPVILPLVPDYGRYHHLIVATPYLTWLEPCAVRVGNAAIRFGLVPEERKVPSEANQRDIAEGRFPERFEWVDAVVHRGQIEILAPGETDEAAMINAVAILGLVTLCLGSEAIGVILGRYSYDVPRAADGEWQHTASPVVEPQVTEAKIRPVEIAQAGEFDLIDRTLPLLFPGHEVADGIARARRIALRSYERGMRAPSFLDKFLAFFMGVEVVVRSCETGDPPRGALAPLLKEDRFLAALEELQPKYEGVDLVALISRLFGQVPITEHFRHFTVRRGLSDIQSQFLRIKNLRDGLVHGRGVFIGPEQSGEAQQLLLRLLRSELMLPGAMRWEAVPHISGMLLVGPLEAPGTPSITAYQVKSFGIGQ